MAGHDIFQDMDRQDIQYAAGEADVQACFFPLQRLHPQLQVQELSCQFLGVLVKIPSLRRRFHAFAAADKERRLHFPSKAVMTRLTPCGVRHKSLAAWWMLSFSKTR